MHHNKCVIVFSSKHKQTKPGAHTEPAEIPAFTQNPKICLVSHLHAYLKQTEPLRKGQELLISFNKPHAPVARGTFSRWVKTMLAAAGVDTVHYGPHTTRAASCSAAANRGASLTSILKAAGCRRKQHLLASTRRQLLTTLLSDILSCVALFRNMESELCCLLIYIGK